MGQDDFAGAEQHLLKLVDLAPKAAEAYAALAELRIKQGRINEAINLYRHALQLNPSAGHIADALNALLRNKGQN